MGIAQVYPNIQSADKLLNVTFLKGIIPIVRDKHIKMWSTIKQHASSEYSANYISSCSVAFVLL